MKPANRRASSVRSQKARARSAARNPTFEPLEDRKLLSTLALDSTFGTGGVTAFPFSAGDQSTVSAVALQVDGKSVEAGTIRPGSSLFANTASVIGVSRLTTSGSLDSTFGTNGIATIQLGSSLDSASAVAIQPNGDIVVVGTASQGTVSSPTSSEIAVARLLPTGKPDTSFGNGTGQALVTFPGATSTGTSVLIQGDGKIVVVGTVMPSGNEPNMTEFGAARLNADGSIDTSFGTSGYVTTLVAVGTTPPTTETDTNVVTGAAIQADGKILIGGTVNASFFPKANDPEATSFATGFALARLNTDGSLDATFGTGGTATAEVQEYSLVTFSHRIKLGGLALQSDGKIVLAGTDFQEQGHYGQTLSLTTRLNPDGSVDNSFTSNAPGIGLGASTNGPLAIQPNGNIVVVNSNPSPYDSTITTLTPSGTILDSGYVPIDAKAVVVQVDGKILAAGSETPTASTTNPNPTSLTGVARINGQGAVGDFFGTGISDLSVDDPATGTFSIETPSGTMTQTTAFGPPSTLFAPVSGDFNNDGKADLAIYDSQDGIFAYRPSGGGADVIEQVGIAGGVATSLYASVGEDSVPVIYYPQYAIYANVPTSSGGTTAIQFGLPGQSIPAIGNFAGGGTELGYYIPKTSTFSYMPILVSTTPTTVQFGPVGAGFTPALGDYDGDGKTDLALYTPQTSVFLYQPSSGGAPVAVQFGPPDAGFVAVPGDYDGDGKTDLAIYNAQYGLFIYRPSSGGKDRSIQFGPTGGAGIAVLTAGTGSDLLMASIRAESVGAGSLKAAVALAPMVADDATPSAASARSLNRGPAQPSIPLP